MKQNISSYVAYKILKYCENYIDKSFSLNDIDGLGIQDYKVNWDKLKIKLNDFKKTHVDLDGLNQEEQEEYKLLKAEVASAENNYYNKKHDDDKPEFDIYQLAEKVLDKYFMVKKDLFYEIEREEGFFDKIEKDNHIKNIEKISKSLKLSQEEQNILEFIWIWMNSDILSKFIKKYCFGINPASFLDIMADLIGISLAELRNLINENSNLVTLGLIEKDGIYLDLTPKAICIILSKNNVESLIKEEIYFEIKDEFRKSLKRLESLQKQKFSGLKTGFYDLDTMGGFPKGEVVLLSSRPGMGKTSFILNLMLNISSKDKATMLFTKEKQSIVSSLIMKEAEISRSKLMTDSCTSEDWKGISETASKLEQLPIYVKDSITTKEIIADCNRYLRIKEKPLDCIFIDLACCLQKPMSNLELIYFYSELKNLAQELKVPIVISHSLGREIESQEIKKPNSSYISNYNIFEKFIDKVIFLYREDYYNIVELEELKGEAEIIIDKNTSGPTGTLKLGFQNQIGKFENPTTATNYCE